MNPRNSMNGAPPNDQLQNTQHRSRPSFGQSVPIPTGQSNIISRERNGSMVNQQQFNMGKSPPNHTNSNKSASRALRSKGNAKGNADTKHVPCKFFKARSCTAGDACPFSHALDPMSMQAPCKYFMKGNCKFGAKCSLAHYLPNGHRVSKADLAPMNSQQYMPQGPEAPSFFPSHDMPHHEIPHQDLYDTSNQNGFYPDYPFLDDDFDPVPDRANTWAQRPYNPVVGSPPTSQFGSPPNDAFSPVPKIHSALNAPLPPSWSGSVPHYAKYGPFGASVPDKFGLASPANSVISQHINSPPLKEPLIKSGQSGLRNPLFGASTANESSIGQRIMSSQRNMPRSMMPVSASVPVRDSHFSDLESESSFLTTDPHDELSTSAQRTRRLSKPEDVSGSFKEMSEGLAIPRKSSNTVGSPPMSSSPSRFKALFEEQQKQKSAGVGIVGSPLRESWMPENAERSGYQISGISQAMARMAFDRTDSTDSTTSRPLVRNNYSRQISSPGLSSQRIDEEGEGAFFPMDADDGTKRTNPMWIESQKNARSSEEQPRPNPNANRPIFGFNT